MMTREIDVHTAETIRVLESIPGGRELLDWMGDYPSFHDAEILGFDLNRRGASLSMSLPGRRDGSPFPDLVVRFAFKRLDAINVSLEHFNHQNVMGDMCLRFVEAAPVDDNLVGLGTGNIEFEIEPCFGAFGTLRATVEKITIKPVANYQTADGPLLVDE
jgi:hypothetical protein